MTSGSITSIGETKEGGGSLSSSSGVLAIIPARGGSKGLPGKNIRSFVGLPLIAHSILLAKLCPEIERCVVSTDCEKIAAVALRFGAEVPFSRPAELARDDSPTLPVLTHALRTIEEASGIRYDYVLLLDPTSPGRLPEDVTNALQQLRETPSATGIIGVSEPDFNPIWHCVLERNGRMVDLIEAGADYSRRQDVPPVYRINALLYLWRSEFIRSGELQWRRGKENLLYKMPDVRALHIDTQDEFDRAELLVQSGIVTLPWLSRSDNGSMSSRATT